MRKGHEGEKEEGSLSALPLMPLVRAIIGKTTLTCISHTYLVEFDWLKGGTQTSDGRGSQLANPGRPILGEEVFRRFKGTM